MRPFFKVSELLMNNYRVLIHRESRKKRQDIFSQSFLAKDETQASRYCDFLLSAFCSMCTYECINIDDSTYFNEGEY